MSPKLTSARTSAMIAVLLAIFVVGTLRSLPQAHAASPPSRAAKLASVTKYRSKSLHDFIIKANSASAAQGSSKTGAEGLDWSTDGCSIKGWELVLVHEEWSVFFKNSCIRHDFGYRNLGKHVSKSDGDLALKSTMASKKDIDDQELTDMYNQCRNTPTLPSGLPVCLNNADKIHEGVSGKFGAANTHFHDHECTPGALCFFDDKNYADRRITFASTPKTGYPVDYKASSYANFNNITGGFGDKTSSIWNNTPKAWMLYEDDTYKGSAVCIGAGQFQANLDAAHFGDKISSIKQLSRAAC